jgi:hypothetical protein
LRGIYQLQIYLVSLTSLIFQLYSDNLNSSAEGASEKLMIDCMLGKEPVVVHTKREALPYINR